MTDSTSGFYQDHSHSRRKCLSPVHTSHISDAGETLEKNTQAGTVMLQSIWWKENWGKINPFLSSCKPQPSVGIDLGSNCSHTPMNSMRAGTMKLSSLSGVFTTERGV